MTLPEFVQPWIDTPLVESAALSNAAGCRILLKLENLQPSGSFKLRGIGNYVSRAPRPDPANPHFYSSSGGNAGVACVHAARALGYPATVVVPDSTTPLMVSKIRAAGAHDVIQFGASWKEADAYLREELLTRDPTGVYVPPFDHPEIWAGNASVILDAAAQMGGERPDAIVCSVGGGGLLNGVVIGMDQVGWNDVPIIACETKGADSMATSLQEGRLVTLDKITSEATSLGCRTVSTKTWENAQRSNVRSVVLSDAEAAMGCWRLADDERLVVELACGVNVALCYGGRLEAALGRPVTPDTKILIVLCGGGNVTLDTLVGWRQQYGYIENKLPQRVPDVPSSMTAVPAVHGR